MNKITLKKIIFLLIPLFLIISCNDEDDPFIPISAKFKSDKTIVLLYDGYWGNESFQIEACNPMTGITRKIPRGSITNDFTTGKLYIKYKGDISENEIATLYIYENNSSTAKYKLTIKKW